MIREEIKGYIAISLATLIIGLSFIFVKIALESASALDLLAHRFTAAVALLLPLLLFRVVKIPPISLKRAGSLLFLALLYPLLFFALQTFGLKYVSASEGGIIFALTPIITLIAASLFLKERTKTIQKVGVLLSIAGVLYIIYSSGGAGGSTSIRGVVLLLLSLFSLVLYYLIGRVTTTKFSAMEITVWMTFLAFISFNLLSLVTHLKAGSIDQYFKPLQSTQFLWSILYLGTLSSFITAFLTNYSLSRLPASQIAVFNNLSPLISIAGGVIILKDQLLYFHIIGAALVILGVIMTISPSLKRRK